jgi:AcrR family transcriptional regulator
VGSRAALEEAVRRTGVDPGRRESVRERALAAALEVVECEGLDAMTLEEVARRAGCAVTSLHTQLGGRDGLLTALFERYSPIAIGVRRILGDRPRQFEDQVRAVYTAFYDAAVQRPALISALVADVLGRPGGPMAGVARRRGVPMALQDLGGWLAEEASKGHCRRLAPALAVPMLLGPLALHLLTRPLLADAGLEVPDRSAAIEAMTTTFCRGMAAT